MSTYADLIERLRTASNTSAELDDAMGRARSPRTLRLTEAADAISRLEREKAELVALVDDLGSQFMQAFDCNGIPYSPSQREVEARYLAFRASRKEPPHAHKDA